MTVQQTIARKLTDHFHPIHLEVLNESDNHNVPAGSESHFKVTIVTNAFDDVSLLQRHRMINEVLAEELNKQIHALALHTYTEADWREKQGQVPASPECLGGGK